MQIFQRQQFDRLWLTIRSNEELGILDTDFIEDYFGNDGQLTLRKASDNTRATILMNPVSSEEDSTPETLNDMFTGFIELVDIENGVYFVEGCVRDVSGNYTLLTESQVRSPDFPTIILKLKITSSQIIINFPTPITIQLGLILAVPMRGVIKFDTPIRKSLSLDANISKSGVFDISVVKYKALETAIKKGLQLETKIEKTAQITAPLRVLYDGN